MKPMKNDFYRVVASNPPRYKYPLYKYYNNPIDWHSTGTVKVSCKDGRVSVKIFETDTINVHELEIWSDDGPVGARITEQLTPPEE